LVVKLGGGGKTFPKFVGASEDVTTIPAWVAIFYYEWRCEQVSDWRNDWEEDE
jgi:hypothetical protein